MQHYQQNLLLKHNVCYYKHEFVLYQVHLKNQAETNKLKFKKKVNKNEQVNIPINK